MSTFFPSTNPTFKTAEVAQDLQQAAENLRTRLQQEKQRLLPLGISLPRNTLENLGDIYADFDKLTRRISDNQLELLQLRSLAKTTEMINSSLDLTNVLEDIMERVVSLVGAERGYVVLLDEETGELNVAVARKLEEGVAQKDDLIFSRSIVKRVMESQEPLTSANAKEDERFGANTSIAGYQLRSIICVPLTFHDRVIGAVYCDNRRREGEFGRRELRLLTGFANHAAIAIENARLFEQIKNSLQEITEIKTLLDNILASIASGVVTTNAEEVITIYNHAAEQIFSKLADVAIGDNLDRAIPALHYHIRNGMRQIGLAEENISMEADLEIEGRGQVHLNLQLSPLLNSAHESQGLALVADDLTEMRKRDATLTAVRRYLPPVMVDNIQKIDQLALGGERHEITIMYVDVRPFDTFEENISPRNLMEILNTYLTVATEGIHHHAGMIDKYMGSEIMCLFNSQLNPLPDDHAWHAVQAALRVASDLTTFAKLMQHGFTDRPFYRIGINTGLATLGNVGTATRREFSAIGDSVNLAKRVEDNAQIGQILISENTYAACGEYFNPANIEVNLYKKLRVKGRTEETTLYEIFEGK